MSSCRSLAASALAAFAILVTAGAHAQSKDSPTWGASGTVTRARAAYERGTRAHAAGDHATAARAFAEADALLPEPASLEAALESAMRADDAVLGAELLERAELRNPDEGLKKTMGTAKLRFAGRTGAVKIDCGTHTTCLASVDGVAADATRLVHVKVGPHAVVVQRGSERIERIERLVDIAAGAVVVVPAPDGSPRGPIPSAPHDVPTPSKEVQGGGLSPVWFVVAVGATAVIGGFTLISGLEALSKHDRFEKGNCAPGSTGRRATDCDAIAEEGKDAQLRTNVGIGLGAAFALATTALGIWGIQWRDGSTARVGAVATPTFAGAAIELRTP